MVFLIVAVQQKDTLLSTSTSAVTLVSSSPASVAMMAASSLGTAAAPSPVATELYIPTASADVAADIAKYTNKVSACFLRRVLSVFCFMHARYISAFHDTLNKMIIFLSDNGRN